MNTTDGDGEVGLAAADVAVEDEVLGGSHEVEAGQLLASPVGRERGVMRLRNANAEQRLDRELAAIGKAELVIIDELGYLPIDIEGARLLFQVIADSYEKRSLIFTSNLEFSRWADVFGDGDMAAAVIDRIVHHGRIIRFHGESYRNTHSLMK